MKALLSEAETGRLNSNKVTWFLSEWLNEWMNESWLNCFTCKLTGLVIGLMTSHPWTAGGRRILLMVSRLHPQHSIWNHSWKKQTERPEAPPRPTALGGSPAAPSLNKQKRHAVSAGYQMGNVGTANGCFPSCFKLRAAITLRFGPCSTQLTVHTRRSTKNLNSQESHHCFKPSAAANSLHIGHATVAYSKKDHVSPSLNFIDTIITNTTCCDWEPASISLLEL